MTVKYERTFSEEAELCSMEDALRLCNIAVERKSKFKISCPFHSERTGSCSINLQDNFWYCFGQCAQGGDAVTFVSKYHNISPGKALRMLRGQDLDRPTRNRPNPRRRKRMSREVKIDLDIVNAWYVKAREELHAHTKAIEFLLFRGLSLQTIAEQNFGYMSLFTDQVKYLTDMGYDRQAVENSGLFGKNDDTGEYYPYFRDMVIMPYMDNHTGKVKWFTARSIGKKRFMHLPGKKPIIGSDDLPFNYPVVLCAEGMFDHANARQAKAIPTISVLGGHGLEDVPKVLAERKIGALITAFDKDKAGDEYRERLEEPLAEYGIEHATLPFPEGVKDIGDFGQMENGMQAFRAALFSVPLFREKVGI